MTNQLKQELQQFTGSEQFFRNPLYKHFIYTEGVRYLAEQAGAYWLIDYIFSNQHDAILKAADFQVWKIKVENNHTASIQVEDGNDNLIKVFALEFTDFPLDAFTLWFIDGTLLLPSEY